MEIDAPKKLYITFTSRLINKLRAEQGINKVINPGGVQYHTIKRLLEAIDKNYNSIELNYKGD